MKQPSENALKLLFEYEVGGGQAYYEKKLSKFTWPGGASGPTIGIGIDTAYYNAQEIAEIFKFLPEDQIHLIQGASGRTGQRGKEYAAKLREAGIVVTWSHAVEIFDELTWTKFSKAAERAFPGLAELCEDAYGAIVSLVFNRGTSMSGDSRREMRNIRALVGDQEYKKIANEFRSMKRIWEGKGLDGLLKRRDAEADLVESCA
jgi:GH24 family phage-related lysozyme (muramidase)